MVTKKTVETNKIFKHITKNTDADIVINICSNGYMVKVQGRDWDDDWKSEMLVCSSDAELLTILAAAKELHNG